MTKSELLNKIQDGTLTKEELEINLLRMLEITLNSNNLTFAQKSNINGVEGIIVSYDGPVTEKDKPIPVETHCEIIEQKLRKNDIAGVMRYIYESRNNPTIYGLIAEWFIDSIHLHFTQKMQQKELQEEKHYTQNKQNKQNKKSKVNWN